MTKLDVGNHKITPKQKRSTHTCTRCQHRFDSQKAKCTSCGEWNVPKVTPDNSDGTILLSEASSLPIDRIKTGPWDKCFGPPHEPGIVTTSVTLIGGAPGAGKSTMSLQLADRIAEITKREIIYIGTEETVPQIKDRAMRIGVKCMPLLRIYPMGSNTDLGSILISRKPSAIFVDSIPGMTGDLDMTVEICKRFKEYSDDLKAPTIVIDHVTKDHDFAGLMQLQHAVDTCLLFTVDEDDGTRELTTVKNRFGPANVSIILEMTEKGLILGYDDDDDEGD